MSKSQEQKEAATYLKKVLSAKHPIYTQTEYGRNYWNAYTKLYIVRKGEIVNITWEASKVLGDKLKDGRIPYGDFDSVYNLGRRLYPNGHKCDGKYCHSNDHVNGENNTHHSDSGYRFKQRSL